MGPCSLFVVSVIHIKYIHACYIILFLNYTIFNQKNEESLKNVKNIVFHFRIIQTLTGAAWRKVYKSPNRKKIHNNI